MNKKRLLNVAKALRDASKVPLLKKVFTMETWGHAAGSTPDPYYFGEPMSRIHIPEGKCGTPACAMGHYAARRDLQRTFSLNKEGEVEGLSFVDEVMEAAGVHFDIDDDEAAELFGEHGCGNAQTPVAAAKYIEKFVKEHA